MDISIPGLAFYRPSVSISTSFKNDSDGNAIGRVDTLSITDTVLFSDTNPVSTPYNSALALSMAAQFVTVTYPVGSGMGLVKNVSVDGDSDFVNKLVYTITVEVRPNISINSIYKTAIGTKKVSSLSCSESIEIPYDKCLVSIPGGTSLPNKGITHTINAQVTCVGPSKIDDAYDVINKLINSLSNGLALQYPGNKYVTGVNSSVGADGSISVDITSTISNSNLFATSNLGKSKNFVNNSDDKTYQCTVTAIESLSYDDRFKVTGYSAGLSESAYNVVMGIYSYFAGNKDIDTTSLATPGKEIECPTDSPKLTVKGCYKTKSISIENNKGGNSASISVELTTSSNADCDNNGLKTEYTITRYDPQPVYVEVDGWLAAGYIVQNFQTKKSKYNEYSVDISSLRNCINRPEVVKKAKALFEEIRDGGTLTSYTITTSKNSCSLKATEYP